MSADAIKSIGIHTVIQAIMKYVDVDHSIESEEQLCLSILYFQGKMYRAVPILSIWLVILLAFSINILPNSIMPLEANSEWSDLQ